MTFDQIISSVRRGFLNDVDKVRWSDEDLLEYANEAVVEIRRVRPDLFLGTYLQTIPVYDGPDDFPLPRVYESFAKDYIVHRAHSREEEYVNDNRAVLFYSRFEKGLLRT